MLQHHNGGTGHQSIASASGGAKSSLQAGHSGKYLGLGNKTGLGGTHRHSLEKLKEYESQLLLSSTAANNNIMNSNNATAQPSAKNETNREASQANVAGQKQTKNTATQQ